MKGEPAGEYECAVCEDRHIVSDAEAFGGGFMPASVMYESTHPMFWRDSHE